MNEEEVLEIDEREGERLVGIDDDKFGSAHRTEIVDAFLDHNLYLRPFVRGDANIDGVVDTGDVDLILDRANNPDLPLDCEDAADVDGDDDIDVADAYWLLNWLLGQGEQPVPPYPNCGEDEPSDLPSGVEDLLTCEKSACEG